MTTPTYIEYGELPKLYVEVGMEFTKEDLPALHKAICQAQTYFKQKPQITQE